MIKVISSKSIIFNYAECEELYNTCKDKINDDDFEDVIKRTLFFSFYIASTNVLIGCIYYYLKGRKLFVNAFANRKHHLINLECFKESLKWFKRNIYATSNQKTAIYCLLKCGFKYDKKQDLYIYRR